MKKYLLYCVLLLFIFFPFFGTPIIVSAEPQNGLDQAIEDALERLQLEELEKYVENLQGDSNESVRERLLKYVNGESIDYGNIFDGLADVFFREVSELFPSFACVIAIALTCGILSTLQGGFMTKTVGNVVYFIAFMAVLIPILGIVTDCYSAAKVGIMQMKCQMEIIFPLLLTLLAASGGTVSVAVCKPSVAFLSTAMVELISGIIFPLVAVLIAFSIANRLSDDFSFSKFVGVIKSINKWLIGIGVSVFGLFFTVQGITSAAYDGIARRAAKYAIGNGIPIIGGFLSGGFDLAIAGSLLIKNSLGYLGIVLMIFAIFQPLVLILTTNLLLRLTSALTSPFGESKISDFLSETADSLNYLAAGVLFTAFLYFLSIVIMISAVGAFL